MDSFLEDWSPAPDSPFARLDLPGDKGPVDFRIHITPGHLFPNKQTVLLTAVTDGWDRGLRSRDWELWQLKVFAAHGKAVVEMDGRGPERREVEPLKGRMPWGGLRPGIAPGAKPVETDPYAVALTYNAASGALSILRHGDNLAGVTYLKTEKPWTLLIGKPDNFDPENLAAPIGWSFDLAFEIAGAGTGPILPPPVKPPVTPSDPTEKYFAQIEDAVAKLRALQRGA